jgi:hypothetical protein
MTFQLHLISLLLLLVCSSGLNWQGAGNMNSDNRTIVMNYISTNFHTSISVNTALAAGDTTLSAFATDFAAHLNGYWDPAWNVVIVYINTHGENTDTVLYGYAFRDHWMWLNGLAMDDGYYVSFIIWKDYNCITWYAINANDASHSTFDSATNTLIYNALAAYNDGQLNDIWWTAVNLIGNIIGSNSAFQGTDKAYTIIVSQSFGARFFG